jgi:hypothetical protein
MPGRLPIYYSNLKECMGTVGILLYLGGNHAKHSNLNGTTDTIPPTQDQNGESTG